MSSPRWSRVTCTPSASRVRTTASASSRVSPATNRSTTRRVAGLPVTIRRRPGRRDAASRAFCRTTGPPDVGTRTPTTLGTSTPSGQGQMSRTVARALIQMYRTEGGDVRDDLQELVDGVSRLLAAPATLEDADFTLLAFCAHSVDPGEAPDGGLDDVRTR